MKAINKLLIALVTAASMLTLVACGGENNDGDREKAAAKSTLIGTFTFQEVIGDSEANALRVTHNESNASKSNRSQILSSVYPLKPADQFNPGLEGQRVSYNIDQRLKLKRDFTYEYEYTIVLGNPGDWGGRFAEITVFITGEYSFEEIADELYSVTLNDPTGGSQTVRSFRVDYVGIYGLVMHDSDDFELDYSYLSKVSGYKIDEYARGRTVIVDKAEDTQKQLDDDIYYPDLFDYVSHFATY